VRAGLERLGVRLRTISSASTATARSRTRAAASRRRLARRRGGTDRPELLPGRVSHGCIRMRNADILRLARLMPAGIPVTIR
jgi:hypothetical protein